MEIYSDAHTFGLKSSSSAAVSNSNLAISWLEATFPELVQQALEGADLSSIRARPYALFDASLSLQVQISSFLWSCVRYLHPDSLINLKMFH